MAGLTLCYLGFLKTIRETFVLRPKRFRGCRYKQQRHVSLSRDNGASDPRGYCRTNLFWNGKHFGALEPRFRFSFRFTFAHGGVDVSSVSPSWSHVLCLLQNASFQNFYHSKKVTVSLNFPSQHTVNTHVM